MEGSWEREQYAQRLRSKQDLKVDEELRVNIYSGWKELEPDVGGS